jgi:hypothetical protein
LEDDMKAYGCCAGLLCAVSVAAAAADFDGSRSLICASQEARTCIAGKNCASSTPREIGAPVFVRIDFEHQVVVGPYRTTPIRVMERGEKQLLLQGVELGLAWSIALDQESGEMAASLVDRYAGFVIFGACTPL